MIEEASTSSPEVLTLLRQHPKVATATLGHGPIIGFRQGTWNRAVHVGRTDVLHGLAEIMDNNPLVCADEASMPGPVATLALIALAPILQAGLAIERPTLLTNADESSESVDAYLRTTGWQDGATLAIDEQDLGSALSLTAICAIRTPADLREIDEIYEERYSRSFYVRSDETAPWDISLVVGKPWACYRLRISPDTHESLLTIQVLAERDGKAGAAQAVHMMNIMAGFEESLGIV